MSEEVESCAAWVTQFHAGRIVGAKGVCSWTVMAPPANCAAVLIAATDQAEPSGFVCGPWVRIVHINDLMGALRRASLRSLIRKAASVKPPQP